jgi:hypothetical protein
MEVSAGVTSERRADVGRTRYVTGTGAVRYAWKVRSGAVVRQDVAFVSDVETGPNWRGSSMSTTGLVSRACCR